MIKIAFFGTGDFSANILKSLLVDFNNEIEINLVVSQPDKPVGRKKILENTPVKIVSEENNIKLLQPNKLKNNLEFFEELNDLDFIVVVAYGKIVPLEVLNAPKYGCINIHGSILPKYRGASPIQESIKNGDKLTGLTIMYMTEDMDMGDILKIEEIEIGNNDKTGDIFKKFEEIGPKLLVSTLNGILSGKTLGKKQDDKKASYCSKISKQDGEIIFEKQTGEEIYNKFRAYYNWPGIWSYYNQKKINFEYIEFESGDFIVDEMLNFGDILSLTQGKNKEIGIICKGGIIKLKQVKLEGKKSIDILSFVNGNKEILNYKFN